MSTEFSYPWLAVLDPVQYQSVEAECTSMKYKVDTLKLVSEAMEVSKSGSKSELCKRLFLKFQEIRNKLTTVSPSQLSSVQLELAQYFQNRYDKKHLLGKKLTKPSILEQSISLKKPSPIPEEPSIDLKQKTKSDVSSQELMYDFLIKTFYPEKLNEKKGKQEVLKLLKEKNLDVSKIDTLFDKTIEEAKDKYRLIKDRIEYIKTLRTKFLSSLSGPSPSILPEPSEPKAEPKPSSRKPSISAGLLPSSEVIQNLVELLRIHKQDVKLTDSLEVLITRLASLFLSTKEELQKVTKELNSLKETKTPTSCFSFKDQLDKVTNSSDLVNDLTCKGDNMICNLTTQTCEPISDQTKLFKIQVGKEVVQVTGDEKGMLDLERQIKLSVLRSTSPQIDVSIDSLKQVLPKPKARIVDMPPVNLGQLQMLINTRLEPPQTISEYTGKEAQLKLKKQISDCMQLKK